MRADALGMFWEDTPPAKPPPKEKVKVQPPERVWERPDYLPGLAEAKRFRSNPVMSAVQIHNAQLRGDELMYDIECYPNYFLVAFTSFQTGEVIYFEKRQGETLDVTLLDWVIRSFLTFGFNSLSYDHTMLALALAGHDCQTLKGASDAMIVEGAAPHDILRSYKIKKLRTNHIDLIEVAPLRASLKAYGGRLHAPRMQDLPFHPNTFLSEDQIDIVLYYCVNDLSQTAFLRKALREQIELRYVMSNESGIDLRSKSDAQIAEAVIGAEIERLNGRFPTKPVIAEGTAYRYRVQPYMQFQTPVMQQALQIIQNAWFQVDHTGSIGMPQTIKDLQIPIGDSVYTMGIGGLHSTEKRTAHFASENIILKDVDVVSYYPMIILNQGLYPSHLGANFLRVYRTIVDRRIAAKRAGDKVTADSLKITINGSFGKLGSKYSILYAPDLLIQTTVSGQLSLLLLIERLELIGVRVVSANTDGIVIKCTKSMEAAADAVVKQWERDTGFETEENQYLLLASRDVNNYIAVKKTFDKASGVWLSIPDGVKVKGAYAMPGLSKNPQNSICIKAIQDYLVHGHPLANTIYNCRDIRQFVSVRRVNGGAVKLRDEGETDWDKIEFLGKTVRWYYAKGETTPMVYATSGNKVPRSEGAKPAMNLPDTFPDDVDYEWYVQEAESMLKAIGYVV